jgi:hypothetical protein
MNFFSSVAVHCPARLEALAKGASKYPGPEAAWSPPLEPPQPCRTKTKNVQMARRRLGESGRWSMKANVAQLVPGVE